MQRSASKPHRAGIQKTPYTSRVGAESDWLSPLIYGIPRKSYPSSWPPVRTRGYLTLEVKRLSTHMPNMWRDRCHFEDIRWSPLHGQGAGDGCAKTRCERIEDMRCRGQGGIHKNGGGASQTRRWGRERPCTTRPTFPGWMLRH